VVVKRFRGEGDPADEPFWTTERRLSNEWAAYRLLNDATDGPPLAPRLYGGDAEAALLVLDDLGDGPCLADRLMGDDPAAATAAFLAYAAGLGRLQAATVGRAGEYAALRLAHGGLPLGDDTPTPDWLGEDVPNFWAGCALLGLRPTPAVAAELAAVAATAANPGGWRAFDAGDACPNNHRLADGGARFFDFEFGGFRHPLLAGFYPRVPFPTCIHVNRVLAALLPRVEAAYRAEFIRGWPAAGDDAAFGRALVHACAYWLVVTLGWALADTLTADSQWGISTRRQRNLLRLETFAALSAQHGQLLALGELAAELLDRLRDRWGPGYEMPLYPAFRAEAER
jgi:hypothetical protein